MYSFTLGDLLGVLMEDHGMDLSGDSPDMARSIMIRDTNGDDLAARVRIDADGNLIFEAA